MVPTPLGEGGSVFPPAFNEEQLLDTDRLLCFIFKALTEPWMRDDCSPNFVRFDFRLGKRWWGNEIRLILGVNLKCCQSCISE